MQLSGLFLLFVAVMTISAVIMARWMGKRNFLRGRKPLSLTEIYMQDFAGTGVSYVIFEKVLELIAQSYHIDSRLLRTSDKLKSLYNLDSWDIGKGTEALNVRIEKDFGITHFEAEPKTIAEFIVAIEKRIKK